jgi:hypothetical protein
MKIHPAALCLHPKDVQCILRVSGRQARQVLSEIRKKYGKENFQPVTVAEFCQYMKMEEKAIIDVLS